MTDEPAGTRPSDHVSREVARLRKERRIPLRELSEKLAALGQPIPVLGLRTIEAGTRRLEVNELVALARAFDVPPIVLMFPIGHAAETELLPGQRLDPWKAAKWFMGRETLDGEPRSREAATLSLFEKHDALMEEAGQAHMELVLWYPTGAGAEKEKAERQWRIALRDLRMVRAQIRQFKLEPPRLEEGLEMVDDSTYRFLTGAELASHFPSANYPPGLVVEELENGNVWPVDFGEKGARPRDTRQRESGEAGEQGAQ